MTAGSASDNIFSKKIRTENLFLYFDLDSAEKSGGVIEYPCRDCTDNKTYNETDNRIDNDQHVRLQQSDAETLNDSNPEKSQIIAEIPSRNQSIAPRTVKIPPRMNAAEGTPIYPIFMVIP